MSSIILTAAAGATGFAVGGLPGAMLGMNVASALLSGSKNKIIKTTNITDLPVQTSTYGKVIPIIYGNVRLAGNVIWSSNIKETIYTSSSGYGGGGKGGGTPPARHNNLSSAYYSVDIAIAICEGKISQILRAWADSDLLDLSKGSYRIYYGDEQQMPDSLMESYLGIGEVPAYRGLAYVVIEDFPLEKYGNRIPNFLFEVSKKVENLDNDLDDIVENKIESMIIIPGSGEFVYDTVIQKKHEIDMDINVPKTNKTRINNHSYMEIADSVFATNQLIDTCPNIKWASPVVCWFTDSLDISEASILPRVEYDNAVVTEPDFWKVGNYARANTPRVTLDQYNRPIYGGTASDKSILNYLDHLREKDLKIMFYPMIMVDLPDKPWRGRISGDSNEVSNFFSKQNGYNQFILHYANLVKGKVDAFIIGSELKDLTKIQDENGNFPVVSELISLASQVKAILGNDVIITYAADWSEYHHDVTGYYHLDPLWASNSIDVVGIDAYFPLTDGSQDYSYDKNKIISGWENGEGYEWFYADEERTIKENLSPAYAWKNIRYWWENSHINPNGLVTEWIPRSKKIWFAEFGFPSVDGCANQPNVFYNPESSESALPRFSSGNIDLQAQRVAIEATLDYWNREENKEMVENLFLWCFDARPYPYYPDLEEVWSDGYLWKYGHWVQGKLGLTGLRFILNDLCARGGVSLDKIDLTQINQLVDGFIINERGSVRNAIEILMSAYFFDVLESDGKIKFLSPISHDIINIPEDDFVKTSVDANIFKISRVQEIELPKKIDILYLDKLTNYQIGVESSSRIIPQNQEIITINLPLVLNKEQARKIADLTLYKKWLNRVHYQFLLPPKYIFLEAGDIINIVRDNNIYQAKIISKYLAPSGLMEIVAVMEDVGDGELSIKNNGGQNIYQNKYSKNNESKFYGNSFITLLDLPMISLKSHLTNNENQIFYLVEKEEKGWSGANIYNSVDNANNYNLITSTNKTGLVGYVKNQISLSNPAIFDLKNHIEIIFKSDENNIELESVSDLALFNGSNLALIGGEIIQFAEAKFLGSGHYILSKLLRGRYGTEEYMKSHQIGEKFILLNDSINVISVSNNLIGADILYQAVTIGKNIDSQANINFAYNGENLKPLAVVHIKTKLDENNNLIISWTRRSRLNGELRSFIDIPVDEERELYEIEIYNNDNKLVRRFDNIYTNYFSYDNNLILEDFASLDSASFSGAIYQISNKIGRGKKAEFFYN